MKKLLSLFITVASCYLLVASSFADDCLPYKTNPVVKINIPEWQRVVVQPLKPMDLWHGNVVATLAEDYEITGDTTSIEDGFCISLKSVDATIGYSDFDVKIDSRHIPDSCAFNAVLAHEDEHIRAYLSVIDDYKSDINSAVKSASNSIMPIFVQNQSGIDGALDTLHQRLQEHPDVILIRQKIAAEQEIRNKKIDQHNTGEGLKKCL